jgi:4-hydroxybenzoate polyprenyltransferase
MKLIAAFFRLVRWLNLLFIALTQVLFQYCIVIPAFEGSNSSPALSNIQFVLLILSSVFIAAGGYIINDYFDINIDRINKPGKLVVEKLIKRRWAIFWHLLLSITGIVLSFYVGWKIRNILLAPANILCVLLLWFYSTTFKKKLLIGNVLISLLSAWVVIVLLFCESPRFAFSRTTEGELYALKRVFKLAFLYGGFAFVISLVREVIKDIEDMQGDLKYGCRTMPIVWGVAVSKMFAAIWIVILIAVLGILSMYILSLRWWWSALYCFVLIIGPLVHILRKLFRAETPADFHQLSKWVKWIMFTGILSMIFFKIYL